MKKNWFRTTVIIVVFLVTIYYLLPLIAKNQYAIVNIDVYDQDSTLIYETNEYEYKIGSNLFGQEFEDQLTMIDLYDSISVIGKLPDYMLRNMEGEIDFTKDQLIKAELVEKTSRVELPTWFSRKELKLGLDLQGGMHLVLEVDTEGLPTETAENAIKSAQQIITNRIDQFGVAEPTIQKIGKKRILVQLPGLRDAGIIFYKEDGVNKSAPRITVFSGCIVFPTLDVIFLPGHVRYDTGLQIVWPIPLEKIDIGILGG